MSTATRLHRARILALPLVGALLVTLGACGGASSSSDSSVDVSVRATAQSVTASSAVMPTESNDAIGVAVSTARVAITGSVTGPCAGGGSATFSVSGGTFVSQFNAVFDAGETYVFEFTQCRSASGAAAVNGRLTLTVVSTTPSLVVDTVSTDLSVALAQRTVTLNGSSRLTQTSAANGANTTTTNRWTTSGIRVDSARSSGSSGSSRFQLGQVDTTRTIVAVNGVPVSSTCEGQTTLASQWFLLPWFITLATLGPVQYGPGGVLISGHWSIDLPDDHIDLRITPSSVSLVIDLGNDGRNELIFSFQFNEFLAAAG